MAAAAAVAVSVIASEVALGYQGTGVCVPPGGSDGVQHGLIEFPEYTAVNVLSPCASCDALSGKVAAVVLTPVGISVAVSSKVPPLMMLTVPLGAPPAPGMAVTVTVREVDWPPLRVDSAEDRSTVNELSSRSPVFW